MRRSLVRHVASVATVLAIAACSDANPILGPAATPDAGPLASRGSHPGEVAANLLVCPSSESFTTSGVIGREGGSLSVGRATLTLPARAVNRPTHFTMTVPASQYVEVEIVAEDRPHFDFDKRASITLDYSGCGHDADEKPLTAWHIDSRSKALIERMPGRRDRRTSRVSFGTDHLSGYALAW